MFVRGLLICVVLRAFSAQAKVITSFQESNGFFYKHTEPVGMDRNTKKICQKLEHGQCHYATLYSAPHRIPLFSAYRLDQDCLKRWRPAGGPAAVWHLEPQLSGVSQPDHMIAENSPRVSEKIKADQAVSGDFSQSGYDRGLLNPEGFQCKEGRKAVLTLTNAAPLDTCFNRIHWSKWEKTLKSFLLHRVNDDDSVKVFIVSGTVPSAKVRMGMPGKPKKVTVPSHIWTAVCYEHQSDDKKSFSFSFMGENQAEGSMSLMSVSDLNTRLSQLYTKLTGARQTIHVFADDCFADSNKLHEVQLEFSKSVNLLEDQGAHLRPELKKTIDTVRWVASYYSTSDNTNVTVKKMVTELSFNSMDAFAAVTEDLKTFTDSACLLTRVTPGAVTDAVQCLLLSQKTAADGSLCSSFSDSDSSCQCFIGEKTKPCCSSPCLWQDKMQGYRCHSGQKLIKCSPPYSLITVNGERCKDDHPCGTYGYSYYWCYKAAGKWGYCSPPTWRSKTSSGQYCRSNHACARYGEDNLWCYDKQGIKTQCCASDSCYTTVKGKTCRSDHPCGYYAQKFLWCYTEDETWDYCCTKCHD